MKIQPLGTRVLVKCVIDNQTEGGLFIPKNVDERYQKGEVLSAGSGQVCGTHETNIVLKRVEVGPGDIVLFDKQYAVDVGNDQFVIDEMHLLCKYDNLSDVN